MGLAQSSLLSCGHDEADLHRLADGELDEGHDHVGRIAADLRGQIAQCRPCQLRWERLISMRRLLVAATLTERETSGSQWTALSRRAVHWATGPAND
jgi:hypothetical protein